MLNWLRRLIPTLIPVITESHRDGGNPYNKEDHGETVRRNPKQIVKAGGYLSDPQTERGCESKNYLRIWRRYQ